MSFTMDWDMCNMAAKTMSCCGCLLQTLQYIRAQGHVQFPSCVVPKPTWQSVVQPAPAGHHPLPFTSPSARCATPEVRLWLSVFALSPCHVPLPLASPCARHGTPEVRLWLVSIMSLCLWQARAPAVERPRRLWLSVFALHPCHVPLPLASPCARCGTPEVRLWLSVFALSPCHVPLPLASPCARRGTPEAPLARGHHVPLPLASPCARCGTPEAPLAVCGCLVSMSCPFASGKPVRPPWNARGAPLAVCLCSLPSCHAFAPPSWHICCDMKVLVSCCIIRAVSKKQRSKEGSFVCKHAAWPHSAPISLFAFLEPHSAQNCLKIEYTLLQFSCVFPVAYSCVQFPAVAFQLQIPVANSIYIGGSIRRRKN